MRKNMCFCETNRIGFRENSGVSLLATICYSFGAHFSNPVRLEPFRSLAGHPRDYGKGPTAALTLWIQIRTLRR
jgi:hypothetical protein